MFDRKPHFVANLWEPFMRKLNTKLNMSTARYPQTDGLTKHVNNETMHQWRGYTSESGFEWGSRLPTV
jgi:hypothetical protein